MRKFTTPKARHSLAPGKQPDAYRVRLAIGMTLTPYMAVDAPTVRMEVSDPPQRAKFRLESDITVGEEGKV